MNALFKSSFLALLLIVGLQSCKGCDNPVQLGGVTNSEQAEEPPSDPDSIGVGITGLDHLPEHLSIQNFWVNGYSADQAGKGGRTVCCAMLPRHWHPGLTVTVKWGVTNWPASTYYMRKEVVPVERYEEGGHLWVHFLADGRVRAISSPRYGPGNPNYPGPHDPILNKEPWKTHRKTEDLFTEVAAPAKGSPP